MISEIVYEGNLRTKATHLQSGSIIETDAPTDNHGKGERFSPTDIVATALGSCMMTIMGIKAANMNVPLEGTTIEVQKIMAENPRRIAGIQLQFHFPKELKLSDKEKTILENAARSCPVCQSIHPNIQVEANFLWA